MVARPISHGSRRRWRHSNCCPSGVRLGMEVQALRQELGGASLRGWLEQRGVDGRQTRQLGTWLERLSLVRPAPRQVATVLFDWVSVPAGTEPCPEAALRAWLARLLAATCSEGRDAARASWPAARIRALRGGELFRIAWDRVASVSRGVATREVTQAAAICLEHASAARLRALRGSDVPRFWRAVGEAIASRDSGHRSLLVANRIILEAVEEGARGGWWQTGQSVSRHGAGRAHGRAPGCVGRPAARDGHVRP